MNDVMSQDGKTIRNAKIGDIVGVMLESGKMDAKIYEVIGESKGYSVLSRVLKQPGYPNAGYKSEYRAKGIYLVLLDEGKGRVRKVSQCIDQNNAVNKSAELESLKIKYFSNFMTGEIEMDFKKRFVILDHCLSPENISHDGELSRVEVMKKHRELQMLWRETEREFGQKVNATDVYKWAEAEMEERREKRREV